MPYHCPIFTCGCGAVYPIQNFMEQEGTKWEVKCTKCGTHAYLILHVPKDLLIKDVVQRVEFERIHGEIK
jgi:hypothetical protein